MRHIFRCVEGNAKRANRAGAILLLTALCRYGLAPLLTALLQAAGPDPFAHYFGFSPPQYLCLYLLPYLLMMGIPLAFGMRLLRISHLFAVKKSALPPAEKASVVALGVAVCLLGNMASLVLTDRLLSAADAHSSLPTAADGSFLTLCLKLLVFALAPAVLEEALMRGLILRTLRPLGDGAAVFVSALLFALMHGNLRQAPYALVLGLVLGTVYIATENLRLCVTVHAVGNALVLLISHILLFAPSQYALAAQTAVLIAALLLGLAGFFYLFRHRRPRQAAPNRVFVGSAVCSLLSAPIFLLSVAALLAGAVLSVRGAAV